MTQARLTPAPRTGRPPLNQDRLDGAEAIRAYIGLANVDQVYRMVEKNKKVPGSAPPLFHDGTGLVARKSSIDAWYERQERLVAGEG